MSLGDETADPAREALAAFAAIRPLRYGLAAAVHPDRWAELGLPAGAAERILARPRTVARLSESLDWLAPGADDFTGWTEALADSGGAARWALRDGAWLWRAGLLLGAARHRAEIAKLVLRKDVAAFKSALGANGDEVHNFALRQATLIKGAATLLEEDGAEATTAATPAEKATRAAGLGLGGWLTILPNGLATRVRLKLPPAADVFFKEASDWPAERRKSWSAATIRVFSLFRRNE